MHRHLFLVVKAVALIALLSVPCLANTFLSPEGVTVVKQWIVHQTDLKLTEAPASGYLDNEEAFIKLWKAWRKDEVPKVDFSKQIVLVIVGLENASVQFTART